MQNRFQNIMQFKPTNKHEKIGRDRKKRQHETTKKNPHTKTQRNPTARAKPHQLPDTAESASVAQKRPGVHAVGVDRAVTGQNAPIGHATVTDAPAPQ